MKHLSRSEYQQMLFDQFAAIGNRIAYNRTTDDGFDHAGWSAISDAGLWRLPVPRELGGYGHSWWEFVAAVEGLASTADDLGFLLSIVAHVGGLRVLMDRGEPAQKARFLPQLMEGRVASTAITEPTGGSDVARMTLAARPGADGRLGLWGRKVHITNAPVADVMIAVGRMEGLPAKRDISLFIVERHAGGIETGTPESMLGNRTSPTGEIRFEGAPIHPVNILGRPGDGLAVLYDMISLDRLLYGILAAAYVEPWLRRTLDRAGARHAFGRPIKGHQHVQQRLVDIKIRIETSRCIAYAALDRLIARHPEASLMCSIAKLVGTEGLWATAQDVMMLFGHAGYEEGEIARLLRDACGTRIAGGTSDIQKVNIFNQLDKLHEKEMA